MSTNLEITTGTYEWDASGVPTIGIDHLTLAEWRTSAPTKATLIELNKRLTSASKNSEDEKAERGLITYSRTLPDGTLQVIEHESGAVTSFPVGKDDAVLIALQTLSDMAGHPHILAFEILHILELLRWAHNDKNRQRVRRAIKRHKRHSVLLRNVWFDKGERKVKSLMDTGIIAEFEDKSRPGPRTAGERLCKIQWVANHHQSMVDGEVLAINLLDLMSWTTAPEMQFFRFGNKRWFGGRKPEPLDLDLEQLAFGHLMLSHGDFAKRNLAGILRRLERAEYLTTLSEQERFYKARGRWRVRLELHPKWHLKKSVKTVATDNSDAAKLVRAYMLQRFGQSEYQPTKIDRDRANTLLKKFSLGDLIGALPAVVTAVLKKKADDMRFGFAEPFFIEVLQEQQAQQVQTQKTMTSSVAAERVGETTAQDRFEKRQRRERLLAQWLEASESLRLDATRTVIERTNDPPAQAKILDSSTDNPPFVILIALDELLHAPANVA